jgi:cyclopropane-fatty-acyl-phospholipid synthase
MSNVVNSASDEATRLSMQLLDRVFGGEAGRRVSLRLWNGATWPADATGAPRPATLVLKHPGALRQMFLPGTELGLAEAYLYDDFDIEGEAEAVFDLANALTESTTSGLKKLGIAKDLLRLPAGPQRQLGRRGRSGLSGRRHSVERDRQAVCYHYDVSNDFYALWLDRRMVYSCAYFATPDEELDIAQERKLDTLCRKLRLRPGQRLLDLGCGWGGLALHAAERYGVDATGITLSQPQVDLANARSAAAGLADRCRVLNRDYREMDEPAGYDALVSVGMFEHVGAALLPTYFKRAFQLLKPGGVFMNHGIARNFRAAPIHSSSFSAAYVFPDGELTPISETLRAAEEAGFEVRDVESLREHYTLTLRHWVRRLEARHAEALQFVDEPTFRVWRLYMAGSAYGFAHGQHNVYQTLLVKPDVEGRSGLPLTRRDWYD